MPGHDQRGREDFIRGHVPRTLVLPATSIRRSRLPFPTRRSSDLRSDGRWAGFSDGVYTASPTRCGNYVAALAIQSPSVRRKRQCYPKVVVERVRISIAFITPPLTPMQEGVPSQGPVGFELPLE